MIQRRLLTAGIDQALRSGTGRPNGIASAPVGVFGDLVPYTVLYPIPGAQFVDSFANDWRDVTVPYQVTSVGRSVDQAEWMADKVRVVLLNPANPITVDAMVVIARSPDTGPQEPVNGGQDIWTVAERFVFRLDAP